MNLNLMAFVGLLSLVLACGAENGGAQSPVQQVPTVSDPTGRNGEFAPATATPPPFASSADIVFVVNGVPGAPAGDLVTGVYPINSLDGSILRYIQTRYRPEIGISNDRSRLYVVDNYYSEGNRGSFLAALTAIDISTGAIAWETVLPTDRQFPKAVPLGTAIVSSMDGSRVYVITNRTPPPLQVVSFDALSGAVFGQWQLQADCSYSWAVPGEDRLMSVCGSDLLFLSLQGGTQEEAITLPLGDASGIPSRYDQAVVHVLGGDVAAGARALFLATTKRQVVRVDLTNPPSASVVFTLSQGWDFAQDPISVSDDAGSVFVNVRQPGADRANTRSGTQLWRINPGNWTRDHVISITGGIESFESSRDGTTLAILPADKQPLLLVDGNHGQIRTRARGWDRTGIGADSTTWIADP